ncbi:MAG: DUF4214 domain-containing protein [Lachnospiraceae bacterium]|nr:DUF4214 domain-containing protein [Lachnospiraceae bacterium]
MKKMLQKNLKIILMALMFIVSVAFISIPMTAYAAPAVHTAHKGSDKDGSKHEGWMAIRTEEDLAELGKNGGKGYLTNDLSINRFELKNKEVNLCLNGYSITGGLNGSYNTIVLNEGAKLNLYDENNNSGMIKNVKKNCGVILLYSSNSEFTMYGGNVGNSEGNGVYVYRGEYTLNGGSVSWNNTDHGGGVCIEEGIFTMNGGSISNNTAYKNEATSYHASGGGVYQQSGTFIMNGGSISNNTSVNEYGGGVFQRSGTFIMNGGSIFGNSSDIGGGVCVQSSGIYILNDGIVSNNTASYYGGGVYTSGTFTMNDGNISNNTASNYGGGVYSEGELSTIEGGCISNNTSEIGGGGVFIAFGTLTMNEGRIVDNTAAYGGGVGTNTIAAFILNEGAISNNTAKDGAGINGCVTMKGGTISDNKATVRSGGLILIGNFVIEGGTIKNNKSNDDYGISIASEGLITGGTISEKIKMIRELNIYSITYNSNQGTGNKIIQYYDGSIPENLILEENRFNRKGYSFVNWNTKEDGSGTSYNEEADRNTGVIELYAQWKPNKYTVKFNANGGNGTMSSQSVAFDILTALNQNTFTKKGYDFKGWNTKADGSGLEYEDGQEVRFEILNSNKITLYAQWEARTDTSYKIEHYKQKLDGTYNKKASETEALTGTTDANVTPEVKTYKGFGSPEKKTVKIKADGTTVVKYYYERNSYTLTWVFAGGSAEGTYTEGSVKYGEAIMAPVPVRNGYTFNGWKTAVPEKMPAKNLTIKATWKAATNTKYTVEHYRQKVDGTYPATANETETLTGKTNASITPEVKTYKGFTAPSTQTAKIKADGTLVVKYYYTRNSYKLTWDFAGGKASGTYTKGTVKYGAKIKAPVPVKEGYEFTGWDKTVAAKMPAKDVTYKAKWRKLTQEEQVRAFVGRFYTIILDRPADEAGLKDWTKKLINKEATGSQVAAGFINSHEFQKKKMSDEEYVTKLYRAFFDREPDKAGYEGWLKELKNGKSRDYVLKGFINSAEFNNLCKKYGINAGSY